MVRAQRSYFPNAELRSFACAKSHNLDLMSIFTPNSSKSASTSTFLQQIAILSGVILLCRAREFTSAPLSSKSATIVAGSLRTNQDHSFLIAISSVTQLQTYISGVHPFVRFDLPYRIHSREGREQLQKTQRTRQHEDQ